MGSSHMADVSVSVYRCLFILRSIVKSMAESPSLNEVGLRKLEMVGLVNQ